MFSLNGAPLLGIGNAATDVVCQIDDDAFLQEWGFIKGQCIFLSDEQTIALSEELSNRNVTLLPGGSAANVVSCFAALGGKATFIGKTAQDACGDLFKSSMDEWNIRFDTPAVQDANMASTQIFTMVSADGERSFAACYGASHHIALDDINEQMVAGVGYVLLDGYMLMSENGPAVLRRTVELAKKMGRQVVFMPADLSVIEARAEDTAFLMREADSVICNLEQALALADGVDDVSDVLEEWTKAFDFGCITDGANGVHAFADGQVFAVSNPYQPDYIESTNGAGDNFAGGFLYGMSNRMPTALSARLGMYCALECLKHQSPRPQSDLSKLLVAA